MKTLFTVLLILLGVFLCSKLFINSPNNHYSTEAERLTSPQSDLPTVQTAQTVLFEWKSVKKQLANAASSVVGVVFYVIFIIAILVWMKMTRELYFSNKG